VYILGPDNELWDFLLWLDNPRDKTLHDMVTDTFEPFLKWSNALTRVDRIELIATSRNGSRDTRIMSPPDSRGRRVPLEYDYERGNYRRTPESKSDTRWILVEEIGVHA